MARPPFARSYPKSREIKALLRDFEAGDYAAVRAKATKLAASDDERTRAAAGDLVSRTEPDPVMKWVFLAVLALIVFVAAWWLTRQG